MSNNLFESAKNINRLYKIKNNKVYDYLRNHLSMIEELESLLENISKYFNINTIIELDYIIHESKCENLIINIHTYDISKNMKLEMLSRFYKEYWFITPIKRIMWENVHINII